MKLFCYAITLALHLNTVLGQHLQGGASIEHAQLVERMENAPLEGAASLGLGRNLQAKIEKYGSEFFPVLFPAFCRGPGGSPGRYETYHGFSEDDCMKKCAKYNTFNTYAVGAVCTAYEYHKLNGKCEIHFERIVTTEPTEKDVKCVGANDLGCTIAGAFETFFSHGNPGFSFCRVGKTKGVYKVCETCKTLDSCFETCKGEPQCVAFEFSEINEGRCELHSKSPTGVAKTKKKSFCYVKMPTPYNAC